MGQWDIFWQWFPFGKAGLRTLMLFISILSIYILRVAQLHIGARTTVSPLHTLKEQMLKFSTIQTLGWYSFSAWFFCEVYIWSTSVDANLAMVDPGKYVYVRDKAEQYAYIVLGLMKDPDSTRGRYT